MNNVPNPADDQATRFMPADPDATVLAGGAPGAAPTSAPAPASAPGPAQSPRSRAELLGSLPTTELPGGAAAAASSPAETVLMSDAAASAETVLMPGAAGVDQPTQFAAPVVDAPATTRLPDDIDAVDDPYRSPVALEDLTAARMPVQVQSPVKSKDKRHLPVWAWIIIIVALLGAGGAAAWYTYAQELWGGKTVPMVVGLSQEAATRQLEAKGFKVEVKTQFADEGAGSVIVCTPEPGRRAETSGGATITVAVARTIPQVVGLQSDAAQKALLDAGAVNIRIQSVNSDAQTDTVVAVSPEEGSTFVSTDEIVIQVATPYVVPNVVGQSLDDARSAIQKAGLTAKVTFVESSEPKNTVVATSPEAGQQLEQGSEVELSVSSPYPSAVNTLGDYFDCSSKEVASFLEKEKYGLVFGARLPNGDAHAIYTGEKGDALYFTASPEIVDNPYGKSDDVLAAGAPFSGIRYEFSAATMPSAAALSASGLQGVMSACGFTGLKETVTQDDLAKLGYDAAGRQFICGYGEAGSYSWAIVIDGSQAGVSVSAMAFVPTRFSGGVDLSKFDNSPAKYIACADLYDASAVKASQFEESAADAQSQDGAGTNQ